MSAIDQIEVASEWGRLPFGEMKGVVMVVGAPDTGKTTLAKYLYWRLSRYFECVAFLDGDPGQSTLGLPATFTLAVGKGKGSGFPPGGWAWQMFIGSVSPRGHMLRVITAAGRLVQAAQDRQVRVIIYDTSGFIDSAHGGFALKQAKIDLLRPSFLLAIQKEDELEPLLAPMRKSRRVRVITLKPSLAISERSMSARQSHRAGLFKQYFAEARCLELGWNRFPIFPYPRFALNHLLAFEDVDGFILSLGIIQKIDRTARTITVFTPLASLEEVNALYLGDITVETATFRDSKLEVE